MNADNVAQNYFINLFNTVVSNLGLEFNMSQREFNVFAEDMASKAAEKFDSSFKDGVDIAEIESNIILFYSSMGEDPGIIKITSCIENYFSDLPQEDFNVLKKHVFKIHKYLDGNETINSLTENEIIVHIMDYLETIGIEK